MAKAARSIAGKAGTSHSGHGSELSFDHCVQDISRFPKIDVGYSADLGVPWA